MKIAMFHELHAGGALRAVDEFAKRLKKKHTVDLYCIATTFPKNKKNIFHKIFFYKFIPKSWTGNNWKVRLYKDTVELYKLYHLHKQIAHKINNEKYDLVFIHPSQYTQAPFLLRFIKTKKIYYCQEPLRIAYDSPIASVSNIPWRKRIYEIWNRYIRKTIDKGNILHADRILANSLFTKRNIMKAYHRSSIVSYLGVDEKIFLPEGEKKDSDILFIGSDDPVDGLPLLQQAIAQMKSKPILKTYITGKDWLASDKDFAKLYSCTKVVVCLAKNEPFGLIPLEAMACEVPVIAISEGGYKETVMNEKTGYLVPRDPAVLAKKLRYLLSHEKIRKTLGKNGRKHILDHWTWDNNTQKLEINFK